MAHIVAGKSNIAKNSSSCSVDTKLIYMNDAVRIIAEACACCWDKPIPEFYDDKVSYVGRRTKIGHTSILEHGNLVTLTTIKNLHNSDNNSDQVKQIVNAISAASYLKVEDEIVDGTYYLLIGGSLRGYEAMYNLCKDAADNIIMRSIAEVLYNNYDAKIFYGLTHPMVDEETGEFIRDAILNEEKFVNVEPDPVSRYFNPIPEKPFYESDNMKFVSVDNINQIRENIESEIGSGIFSDKQISRMTSLTIMFKGMSRTCTHQLVRHRNGITQESQRYVDYSDSSFADPLSFKPDKYDINKKYDFNFGGKEFSMTSAELGAAEIGIYNSLREQGMMKEDARSFLPSNVKCHKIFMTFTYETFAKFLFLRCAGSAQAEIRTFAIEARDASANIFDGLKNNVKKIAVDEIISDKEVIMNNIIENEPELKKENEND